MYNLPQKNKGKQQNQVVENQIWFSSYNSHFTAKAF